MSRLYDELKKGLEQAIDYEKGKVKLKTTKIKIEPLPNIKGKQVKKIRERLNLTQNLMAKTCGVSKKTIEAWESGQRIPNGPSQKILHILQKNPKALEMFGVIV